MGGWSGHGQHFLFFLGRPRASKALSFAVAPTPAAYTRSLPALKPTRPCALRPPSTHNEAMPKKETSAGVVSFRELRRGARPERLDPSELA